MLVAATQASATGERRKDLASGWAVKALTSTSAHHMVKTLAIIAAELYLSARPANLACNALLLMDSNLADKATRLPIDQGLFLGFRQALARYTRERGCPAMLGPVIINLSNFTHLLQSTVLPDNQPLTLHFTLQLGLLSTGYDIMEGGQQASPPAPRMLVNYLCSLAGRGALFTYIKRSIDARKFDSAIESFISLLASKAHFDISITQSSSQENNVNQIYLNKDLRTMPYPRAQLCLDTVEPFKAMRKKAALLPSLMPLMEVPTRKRSADQSKGWGKALLDPNYLETKFNKPT